MPIMVRNERIMPPAFCRQRYPSIPTPRTPRDMITAEYATTVRVTGTVFANSSVTGFPVPREIPKSMWSASTTQSKYCTGSGLSRPSMTRASSMLLGHNGGVALHIRCGRINGREPHQQEREKRNYEQSQQDNDDPPNEITPGSFGHWITSKI